MESKKNKYDHVDQLNLYLIIQTFKSCVLENSNYQTDLALAIKASEKFRRIDDTTIKPLEEWENICKLKIAIAEEYHFLKYIKCRAQGISLENFEQIDLENSENQITTNLEQPNEKVKRVG